MFGLGKRRELATNPAVKGMAGDSEAQLFDEEFQRKLDSLVVVSRKVQAGTLRAERRAKKRGSGIEFADHREYAPGDDFRHVDWNAYRRFGRLLVRLYEEQEDLSVYLLVDCSGSMGFGRFTKFDQARRLCAALAYIGLANLDRVSVVGLGESACPPLPPTRGKNRIFKIFRYLEGLEATGETDLGAALSSFVAQNKRRGVAVLLSDLYDPAGYEGAINTLRYNKFEPYVLHVEDPPERLLEAGLHGDLSIVDCETGTEREVTVTDGLLRRLQRAQEDFGKEVAGFCTRSRVPYFSARSDVEFDVQILALLRRGGILR